MCRDLAVVMDGAGTILRMYRVAKDIDTNAVIERVVTWELIMEKNGRALVVPQMDPEVIFSLRPDDFMGKLIAGQEKMLEISCSSSPISREEAIRIVLGSRAHIRDLLDVHIRVK